MSLSKNEGGKSQTSKQAGNLHGGGVRKCRERKDTASGGPGSPSNLVAQNISLLSWEQGEPSDWVLRTPEIPDASSKTIEGRCLMSPN